MPIRAAIAASSFGRSIAQDNALAAEAADLSRIMPSVSFIAFSNFCSAPRPRRRQTAGLGARVCVRISSHPLLRRAVLPPCFSKSTGELACASTGQGYRIQGGAL